MIELKALCQEILDLYKRVEYLERTKEEMNEYARELEAENRRLKYEYPDSKRNMQDEVRDEGWLGIYIRQKLWGEKKLVTTANSRVIQNVSR